MADYFIYVNKLINLALQTVRAQSYSQDQDPAFNENALYILNEILGQINSTGVAVPFQSEITFDVVAGKSIYTIGNIVGADVPSTPFVTIEYVNLILSGVRYPVTPQDDMAYFDEMIYIENRARPQWVRIERHEGYSLLDFLPVPDQIYTCVVHGKKEIPLVDMQDYIGLPVWYLGYLRLELAKRLNNFFGWGVWDSVAESELIEAEIAMLAASKEDWRVRSESPVQHGMMRTAWNIGVTNR